MSLNVTQPVINNTTGITGGTLTLTPDTSEMANSTVTVNAATVAATIVAGNFYQVTFNDPTYILTMTLSGNVADLFIVKNVGAISGSVQIIGGSASIVLNQIPIGTGNITFGLSSGKKLVIYTKTANKISVTYV
jgi:hypothetical protein